MNSRAVRPHGGLAALLWFLLALGGCAQTPSPVTYVDKGMAKMQSAAHWRVLADDVAGQIALELGTIPHPAAPALTIEEKPGPFNEAFRKLLLGSLLRQPGAGTDFYLSSTPGKGLEVEYQTQLIRHRTDRFQRPPAGLITLAGTMLRVVRDVGADLIIPAALLLDVGVGAVADITHHEILVTTTIKKGDAYLFHRSDLYYVNDLDTAHYRDGSSPVTTRSFQTAE